MTSVDNTPYLEKIKQADSTTWEDSLHIKPIRTFFDADSTYHSDYSLRDSLMFSIKEKRKVKDDTLILNQTRPVSI